MTCIWTIFKKLIHKTNFLISRQPCIAQSIQNSKRGSPLSSHIKTISAALIEATYKENSVHKSRCFFVLWTIWYIFELIWCITLKMVSFSKNSFFSAFTAQMWPHCVVHRMCTGCPKKCFLKFKKKSLFHPKLPLGNGRKQYFPNVSECGDMNFIRFGSFSSFLVILETNRWWKNRQIMMMSQLNYFEVLCCNSCCKYCCCGFYCFCSFSYWV